MDTRTLILFSLVPTALGHLVNTLLMVPLLGTPLYLLMPWAAALFCLWAGGRCGRAGTRLLPALLLTQWLNVLCLGLYLWQFHFGDGTAPSLLLSGLAQAPGSCLSLATSWLVHRSLQPVRSGTIFWGPQQTLLMLSLSTALLAALFLCGYLWGRHKRSA